MKKSPIFVTAFPLPEFLVVKKFKNGPRFHFKIIQNHFKNEIDRIFNHNLVSTGKIN